MDVTTCTQPSHLSCETQHPYPIKSMISHNPTHPKNTDIRHLSPATTPPPPRHHQPTPSPTTIYAAPVQSPKSIIMAKKYAPIGHSDTYPPPTPASGPPFHFLPPFFFPIEGEGWGRRAKVGPRTYVLGRTEKWPGKCKWVLSSGGLCWISAKYTTGQHH